MTETAATRITAGNSQIAADLIRSFCAELNRRFWNETWLRKMAGYRARPEAFAKGVLGSAWWEKQAEVAKALSENRRVAVKSANGVGKTYLAADLALWFLYTHHPSIVLTTAPTARQVRHLLWEEIRRRFHGAKIALPGEMMEVQLKAGDGWYALGLSTDEEDKFQGFHAEHLLIIFDEASGVPDEIWEAAEGVAVGRNNRILAIGNPLRASGRFYEIFRSGAGWSKHTISALEHPNVTDEGREIPGAVTAEAVQSRVEEWCEEAEGSDGVMEYGSNGVMEDNGDTRDSNTPLLHHSNTPEVFEWRGRWYRPDNEFRSRVLGEFPDSDENSLIPLRWIEAAMARTLAAQGYKRMAADIARFGVDCTAVGVRVGPVLTRLEVVRGNDTMASAGLIASMAYEEHPQSIAIDDIGVGGGVVDRLVELGIEGLEPVNVSKPASDSERFTNLRAELYWRLRERFRAGEIAIPQWDDELCVELASIRYGHDSSGKIKIESKDEMRKRGLHSPDRADMLALLFDRSYDAPVDSQPGSAIPSPSEQFRREMENW